jgi:hypothetical protein
LVYDGAHHAITIYLPTAMNRAAHPADAHRHAISGEPAVGGVAPPALYREPSHRPYHYPQGQAGVRSSSCPLCPEETYDHNVLYADGYECAFERQRRDGASRRPYDHLVPHSAWGQ